MKAIIRAALAATAILAGLASATAADHQVRMLNVGPDDKTTMVFDPPLLHVNKGDTVTFVPSDRGHNSASMPGMLPRGGSEWASAISEPVTVTFNTDGTYGYICEPHYGLGMVGLVLVGDFRTNLEAAQSVRQRGRAAQRFRTLFKQVQALPAEHPAGAIAVPAEPEASEAGSAPADAAAGADAAAEPMHNMGAGEAGGTEAGEAPK